MNFSAPSVDGAKSSSNNLSWFDEMKMLIYKQMTPHVIKEEMEFNKFIDTTLHFVSVNKLTMIFYH